MVNNVNKTTTRRTTKPQHYDAQRFRDGSLAAAATTATRAKTASPDAGVITKWYAEEEEEEKDLLLLFTEDVTVLEEGRKKASREGKREVSKMEEATRRW